MIFMQGIYPEEYDNTPGNVEIIRDEGFRNKHIRVRGSPIDAMAAMNRLDDK